MIQTASSGSNPAPDEGVIDRPITQADVKVLAARLAEAKTAAQNYEEDSAAIIDDDIEVEIANGDYALQQPKKATVANRPLPPVVPANIPAVAIQAPVLAPVRRANLPELVPGDGAEANPSCNGSDRDSV